MREILFRGKRLDNGEWIEGCLFKLTLNGEVVNLIFEDSFSFVGNNVKALSHAPVDPNTVGQYIGLTDRNGKRIFEGDILKGFDYPFYCDGEFNYFAEIVWFDNSPAFGIYTLKNPKSNVRGISNGNTDYFEDFNSGNWEVIGNIHDNPELLK